METATKTVVKSAEQKMLEKATEEYVSKVRAILANEEAGVRIEIGGCRLSKMGHIAECAGLEISKRCPISHESTHLIRKPFSGEGYTITEISE